MPSDLGADVSFAQSCRSSDLRRSQRRFAGLFANPDRNLTPRSPGAHYVEAKSSAENGPRTIDGYIGDALVSGSAIYARDQTVTDGHEMS